MYIVCFAVHRPENSFESGRGTGLAWFMPSCECWAAVSSQDQVLCQSPDAGSYKGAQGVLAAMTRQRPSRESLSNRRRFRPEYAPHPARSWPRRPGRPW